MKRMMRAAPLAVFTALIIAVPSVWANWVQDGVALCTATGVQQYPAIASDGAGGAIVTWFDARSGNNDIYAQRADASGVVQWTANGVALCTASYAQEDPAIASDGAGGAIVTWEDYRASNYNIYAQRVNSSGGVQWTANGAALCTATGNQAFPQIISDGAGSYIVTWLDYRNGASCDIYAQKVNASGVAQWTANGVPLCTATGNQASQQIISDGAGGAIVTWLDLRSGNGDIYAQRVNASGTVQWTADGVALCTATEDQDRPQIASNGAGGAFVTWEDDRGGTLGDIYAQAIGASGVVQWTVNGIAICAAVYNQIYPTIVSDGAGGAIVAWQDGRGGSDWDIYAQKVNASGTVQWTDNGVALCAATGNQGDAAIVSDGAIGAIVTWYDDRSGSIDIFAQRVSVAGVVQWTANGVALCAATGNQYSPAVVFAGAGGTIAAWTDERSGAGDIYVQSINAYGMIGFRAPIILSVQDVPHDQGGWVRITVESASADNAQEPLYPVSTYNVWQRVDDPALLATGAEGNGNAASVTRIGDAPPKRFVDAASVSGWPIREVSGRYFVSSKELAAASSLPPGTWELLGSFAAYQETQYIYLASTVADSAASGVPYSVYVVSAHTTTPSVWFASDPDSGYSVDNISPEVPGGLAAEQSYTPLGIALSWNVTAANDFSNYAVYRGTSEGFVPGPGNRVATPTEPEYFDGGSSWSSRYYYKISAIDVHDNQSGFALLAPDGVTGTDTPKAPESTYLSQNYPNPFNPATRIAFGLSAPAHVSLRIYDAAGRLVRALVNDERRAGRFEETWDGRDSNGRSVASGIYFYRLNAGAFESTKKMILLR
jgi:hypothetical protein